MSCWIGTLSECGWSGACGIEERVCIGGRRAMRKSVTDTLASLSIVSVLTIEFVNVAGTATIIHHTRPVRNAFPFPFTRFETSLPSRSATYKLSIVLTTRNTLWLMISLNSWLRHPGITILSRRSKFLKNSRFSSTFFGLLPSAVVTLGVWRRWRAA